MRLHDYREEIDGPQGRIEAGNRRILGKGGGGGGDGGAAQREAERQARIAAGTDAVNRIFGVGGQTQPVKTGTKLAGYKSTSAPSDSYYMGARNINIPAETISVDEYNRRKGAVSNPNQVQETMFGGNRNSSNSFDQSEWLPVYEDVFETVESDASKAAKARQALYDTTKEDVRSYYTKQLEEDKANAMRQLNFQKARQGTFGSSQANDIDTEFQKAYDIGLLDVANRSDTAATNFKTSDEQSRLNLISKVVAGLDQGTAAQNAAATLQTNANAAKEAYASSRMANVFSDLLGAYNQGQYIAGTQSAKQQQANQYGNFYPSSGDDGTITKAG